MSVVDLGLAACVSMSAREINFSDPRVVAAMKVLGITAENLRPKEPNITDDVKLPGSPDSAARQDMARMRFEKNEALRQRWLKEVKEAAAAINEADVDGLVGVGAGASLPSQFTVQHFENMSHDRMEKQREKLEEQRKRNKSEIQRALEEKLTNEQKAEMAQKRQEDQRKRFLELQKEQKVQNLQKADKRKDRTNKNRENLKQIAQSAREKMRELDTKLKTTCKAAWEKAQSTRVGDEQKRKERRDHMDKIFEARDREDDAQHNKRVEAYMAQMDKEQLCEQRLEEKKDERIQRAYAARARFADKIKMLHEEQEEEDLKRHNKGFKDLTDKIDTHKARAEELMKAKVTALTDARTNRYTKVQNHKEERKEEEKQQTKDARRRLRDAVDKGSIARSRVQNETKYKVSEYQDINNELVLTNKERLRLAEDHRREQAISRLHANTARTRVYQDERSLLNQQRKAIQKENMIEKASLGIALTGIRDTSPKKVNELLKNLDLPLLKMEESKEEAEEGEGEKRK